MVVTHSTLLTGLGRPVMVQTWPGLKLITLPVPRCVVTPPPQLQVGDVVSGVVLSVKPYGAFVDVGGATGLLHVSEISTEYVVDVSDILSEGDQLKVS